jgi:hypothetical protein
MTGGTLAEPEGRIPWLGDIALFQARPYLLPVLAMAIWSEKRVAVLTVGHSSGSF